jgi:pimeloyl-ACP methyl ester carboxylesterase
VTTFVLVHGAWHGAWCWTRLVEHLNERGHAAIAVNLPCDDSAAGCATYADVVCEAARDVPGDMMLVGHSLGGLTIPLVAAARPVRALVFLCALLPRPGVSLVEQLESESDVFVPDFGAAIARDTLGRSYWSETDAAIDALYPDCPRADAESAARRLRPQGRLPSTERCPLERLPGVPSVSILASEDAAIAPAWSRRASHERLGRAAHELPGGHSPFLSRPAELADLLTSVAATA